MLKRLKNILTSERTWLPILSAVLMALAFPPYGVWPLCFVALVPFLHVLLRSKNWKEAAHASLAIGISIVYTGFYWVGDVAVNFGGLPWIVGKLVLVAFSLFGELQFLFFGLSAYALLKFVLTLKSQKLRGRIMLAGIPVLYTGLDFLYPKIFPNTLGHGLYGWFQLAQIAEFTGVPGLTFLMLATNAAIACLLIPRTGVSKRYGGASLASILIALAALHFWGAARVRQLDAEATVYPRSIKFSLIQANIGDVEKLESESGLGSAVTQVLNKYKKMSLETRDKTHPDAIVWPETAYPLLYTHFQLPQANASGAARDEWVADLMKELKTPLLFGGYSRKGDREYNTVFYLKSPTELAGLYTKNILLAFGEYVPLGPFAPLVISLVPTIADFGRGAGPMIFEVPTKTGPVKVSPQICYEGINPDFTRLGANLGADLILNVTNDSWFGNSSEPWIHFMITMFRAIELRMPLVRSTNTGFSAVVDQTGRVRERTSIFAPAIVEAEIKLPAGAPKPTFYARFGDVFGIAMGWIAIVLTIWATAWVRLQTKK